MANDKKLEELITASKKALTELKVSREAKVWMVKLLRETDKGFATGAFYVGNKCYCAYGVASMEVSNGCHTSPGLASMHATNVKLGGYLIELYNKDFTNLHAPGLATLNDKCSKSHKETSRLLQGLWGVTEEEIAEFKV